MPIYEYICDNCNHELEAFQTLSEARLTECPECNHSTLRKKVSAAGFRLKGGGWYETDFKGKSDKKRNLGESDNKSGDKAEKSDSSSDKSSSNSTKPAAKSESSSSSSAKTSSDT